MQPLPIASSDNMACSSSPLMHLNLIYITGPLLRMIFYSSFSPSLVFNFL
jgi:hypothetical protein